MQWIEPAARPNLLRRPRLSQRVETPRLIVVIGIWLIFGPQVPVLLLGLFLTLSNLFAPGHTYSYGDGSSMTPTSDGVVLDRRVAMHKHPTMNPASLQE